MVHTGTLFQTLSGGTSRGGSRVNRNSFLMAPTLEGDSVCVTGVKLEAGPAQEREKVPLLKH